MAKNKYNKASDAAQTKSSATATQVQRNVNATVHTRPAQQHVSQSLDQQRAAFVWDRLTEARKIHPALFDPYTKLTKGAGTLIMQNGLMPTLAFYGDKAKGGAASRGQGNEHLQLLSHLLQWLEKQGLISGNSFEEAMNSLLTKSSRDYRAITEECLALIRWIRHFASALNKME